MSCPYVLNPETGKYISSYGSLAKKLGLVPNTNIPKILWCFWNSPKLPPVVAKCIETWKIYNPEYKINIVNLENISHYIPEVDIVNLRHADESFARLSDFIRLHVLYKYGGFWIDASTLCTMPFDDWMKDLLNIKPNVEFIGFFIQYYTRKKYFKKYPVIESWFFGCSKKSPFVKKWRDEFMRMTKYEEVRDYVDDVVDMGIDLQHIDEKDDADYLAIHVAAQVVLQTGYSKKNMILLKADGRNYKNKTAGPIEFWVKTPEGNDTKRVQTLCTSDKFWSYPFIKLVGSAREAVENNNKLRKCIFDKIDKEMIKHLSYY